VVSREAKKEQSEWSETKCAANYCVSFTRANVFVMCSYFLFESGTNNACYYYWVECLHLKFLHAGETRNIGTVSAAEDPDWWHLMIIFKYPLKNLWYCIFLRNLIKHTSSVEVWTRSVLVGPKLYCKIKITYQGLLLSECNISELLIAICEYTCIICTVHSYTNMVVLHVQ